MTNKSAIKILAVKLEFVPHCVIVALMQNKSWHSKSFFSQTFFFARQKLIKKPKMVLPKMKEHKKLNMS